MNNMDQEKYIEQILPGEIIIATNLAGRGTDIKTDEIEHFGGLHIILTFLPPNQRVEEQAMGRTARQGKKGTGQLILLELGNYIPTIQSLKELRDTEEKSLLTNFKEKELKITLMKDKLFTQFCSLLTYIRVQIRNELGILDSIKGCWKNK